ncbi:hypothetical protein GW17_00031506 [Ensete ventricosum]|nr:hypothetical protein GW17_00031506 [Ensete ventricosum]
MIAFLRVYHGARADPKFVYGVLSPMQESGRLLLNSSSWLYATDLRGENEKLLAKLEEATRRLEILDKELNDVRGDLSDVQRKLKEQWDDRWKADDDLLEAITELEARWTKLPKKVIEDYKESTGFKLDL